MGDVSPGEEFVPCNIKTPVLLTSRLVLRLPHAVDTDNLALLADNRRISGCFDKMPYPFSRADAADFIRRAQAGQLGSYVYAITRAETGEFIGCCGIGAYKAGSWLDWPESAAGSAGGEAAAQPGGSGAGGKAPLYSLTAHNNDNAGAAASRRRAETELFLWLGQPYWGRGYGSEVALALTDIAFRATNITALYARADLANRAAGRILAKCGFVLLGAGAELAAGEAAARAQGHYQLSRESWLRLRSQPAEGRQKPGEAAAKN